MAHVGDDGDGGTHDQDHHDQANCEYLYDHAPGALAIWTATHPSWEAGVATAVTAVISPLIGEVACDPTVHLGLGAPASFPDAKVGYDPATHPPPSFEPVHSHHDPFIDDHNNAQHPAESVDSHGFDWQATFADHTGPGFDWQASLGNDSSFSAPQMDGASSSTPNHGG